VDRRRREGVRRWRRCSAIAARKRLERLERLLRAYTHFRFSALAIEQGSGGAPSANVSVTVTNTGAHAGWAVPELYVSLASLPGVPQPPRQLKGFAKVALAPGQSQRVSLPLAARAFSYWSDAANGWRVAPGCDKIAVGSSSRELPLAGAIAVGGASCPGG
jgi:beta-glucosidase